MIIIQTYRTNKATGLPEYKDYYATSGIAVEMAAIRSAKENNDMTKYEPITIYNVFDTEE